MKTPKSSDSEEVTPSKKVLKQARLPFKTISDVSPKPAIPLSRKRKLSAPASEPVTKVGKVVKKDTKDEILLISDDDSNTGSDVIKVPIQLNPFVKLVDTAWKKKLQKAKGAKKRKSGTKKSKTVTNGSLENIENKCDGNESDNVESLEGMDVDGTEDTESNVTDIKNCTEEVIHKSNSTEQVSKGDDSKPASLIDKSISFTDSKNYSSPNASNEKLNINEQNGEEDSKLMKFPNKDLLKSPKRSERIKSKTEDKVLDTSVSNCDESLSSDPSTPRRSNRNLSLTNSQGDSSLTDSTNTNLTPKQLQKKIESTKKKEEREKEKFEREKKKQLEKEEREKQRREKEEQRKREREEKEEAKKKEREEKEEQRKKEKEEKEKQKELEKKQREEKEEQKRREKEEKEEQKKKEKEAKEEEKRKKQEAIELEKQEQEQKKKKAAEAFVSFFVPKQKAEKDQVTIKSVSKNDMLSSFTIKSDMRLAPTTRVHLNEVEIKCLDNLLQEQNVPEKSLYIKSLKDGSRTPLTGTKTWPLSDQNDNADDDVMIVEDELPPPVDAVSQIITCEVEPHEKLRPKLLAFHDNRRPPYWGTWRKKSAFIKARQPFKTDEKLLDYEVDSDEDWEEEQDGESIDGSAAGSDDEQDADEYEVDNEVFVPHGYLSDEEATMDEDDVLTLSPETQKARLKHLEDEFENEMKKPTEKLKPWYYGLSWETENSEKPEKCADSIWNYFGKFSMIMNDPTPLLQPSNDNVEPEKKKVKRKKTPDGEQQSPKSEKKKKIRGDEKDGKKPKMENKKPNQDMLKNQPGINTFLKKFKTS